MEDFFLKCKGEYDSIDVQEVAQKVSDASGFIVEFELMQRQLSVMEKYHQQLRLELTNKREELEEKLRGCKDEVIAIKDLLRNVPQDKIAEQNQLASQFKLKCSLFKSTADEIKHIKIIERTKLRAISQWIDSHRLLLSREGHSSVPISDLTRIDLDRDILEETLRLTLHKIDDTNEKRNYEDMLTLYLEKTSEREVEL